MVDVRALEAHHIGHQAVGLLQGLVGGGIHGGVAVPAEGLQGLLHKGVGVAAVQASVTLGLGNELQCARREDATALEDLGGLCAQRCIGNQLQAQQRGEDTKRVGQQCLVVHGAKGRGVHGNAGHREVVIAHGLHAHHGEQAAQRGQFLGRAHADGTMALHIQALELAAFAHALAQLGVGLQRHGVDIGHQVDQGAVLRHFLAVHLGHGTREARADLVDADKAGCGGRCVGRGAHDKTEGQGFVEWPRRWRGRRNMQHVLRRHDFGQTIIRPAGHTRME